MEQTDNSLDMNLASFSARVVAFGLDLGLFAAAVLLAERIWESAAIGRAWLPAWAVLFLLYQAYFSSGGRRSLGKALVGLRVVGEDRAPLAFDRALARSMMYLASSVLDLGFLWSLFNAKRQCWHDLVADSVVVDTRPRSPLGRGLLRAGACAAIAAAAGVWHWNNVARPRYDAIMDVAYARTGLEEMKRLQTLYFYEHGRFADNLSALADQSGEPQTFMRDMSGLFDRETGVTVTGDKNGYRIEGRANDDARTLVAFNGP